MNKTKPVEVTEQGFPEEVYISASNFFEYYDSLERDIGFYLKNNKALFENLLKIYRVSLAFRKVLRKYVKDDSLLINGLGLSLNEFNHFLNQFNKDDFEWQREVLTQRIELINLFDSFERLVFGSKFYFWRGALIDKLNKIHEHIQDLDKIHRNSLLLHDSRKLEEKKVKITRDSASYFIFGNNFESDLKEYLLALDEWYSYWFVFFLNFKRYKDNNTYYEFSAGLYRVSGRKIEFFFKNGDPKIIKVLDKMESFGSKLAPFRP